MLNSNRQDSGAEKRPTRNGLQDWWLHVATQDLAPPAQERIRREIEEHYADAVRAHLAAGVSECEAKLAALAELGDPEIAAKRFCKRHLTAREASRIQTLEGDAVRRFNGSDFGMYSAGLFALVSIVHVNSIRGWLLEGCLFVVCGFYFFALCRQWLFRRMPVQLRLAWFISYELLCNVLFGIGTAVLWWRFTHSFVFGTFLSCLMVVVPFVQWIHLWHKLEKINDQLIARDHAAPS